MFIVIFTMNLIFLQAFTRDVMFYLLFSFVLFQVILFGHNVLGGTNDGFVNNILHRNQKPINHFQFYPIELSHPRILPSSTCIIVFFKLYFMEVHNNNLHWIKRWRDGLEGFSKSIIIKINLPWIKGQNNLSLTQIPRNWNVIARSDKTWINVNFSIIVWIAIGKKCLHFEVQG
jgi:hypothetical protein